LNREKNYDDLFLDLGGAIVVDGLGVQQRNSVCIFPGIVLGGYIVGNKRKIMISRLLMPAAFALGVIGLVFMSVPFVLAAMAFVALSAFDPNRS
jgi:hypothetical protein